LGVQRQLEDFIRALRAAEVRVSVAEAIEAHEVVATFGYGDRALLKDSLALTLAKTVGEKQRFAESFDLFFQRQEFTSQDGDEPLSEAAPETGNDLADMMMSGDGDGLAAAMERAGQDIGVGNVRYRTQVNFLTRRMLDRMGLREMEQLIAAVNRGDAPGGQALSDNLEAARTRLFGEARDFVERQFDLYGRFEGERLRESFLERTSLAAIDRRDYARMNTLIRRMAKKLASRYVHRHKRTRKGHLDVRRTLRVNMAHGGIPFETIWKQKRIEKPKIVAICDVSRSVAATAQFLLMFLYNLNEILSDIRSFAFSSYLIEIADALDDHDIEEAIPVVLDRIGFMPTDYGRALDDLKTQFGDTIDRRTTVIFLGDARSNYGDPRADVMKWLNQRAKRVVWLNPEPETFWGTGDSEMPRYRPYCHVAKTCRTIKDLARVVDDIMRSSTRG
jgi:uncharacterized protein